MNSEEKRKIGYGFNLGATTGSIILGSAPLLVIFVGTLIFGLIGLGIMLITRLIKMLTTVLLKKLRN